MTSRPEFRVRRRSRRNSRSAVGILWFICATLPLIWFLGALSTDTMRVIVAQRQAGQLADAAALAAATQYARPGDDIYWDPSGMRLHPERAVEAAEELIDEAVDAGVARTLDFIDIETTVSRPGDDQPDVVTVTISYRVDGLMFFGLATNDGSRTTVNGTQTRSAQVCVPGLGATAGTTDGLCTRPRDNV